MVKVVRKNAIASCASPQRKTRKSRTNAKHRVCLRNTYIHSEFKVKMNLSYNFSFSAKKE